MPPVARGSRSASTISCPSRCPHLSIASGATRARCTSSSTTSGARPRWSGTSQCGSRRSTSGCARLRLGIDTHAITSHFALPLLIQTPGGLVVEVNDGTTEYNDATYRVSFFYDLVKSAVLRMAFALGHELEPHGCTAVSLTPGWLRSEAMLDAYGVTEENWFDATKVSPAFRDLGVATVRRPGGRRPRARSRGRAVERPVVVERAARADLRLHGRGRQPSGRMALPRRGARPGQARRHDRLPLTRRIQHMAAAVGSTFHLHGPIV